MGRSKPHSERGATLIELIIAIFIGAVLIVYLSRFFASQNKTYIAQMDSADLRGGVRAVTDLMQREFRSAGFDPTGTGFVGLSFDSTAASLSVIVRSDYNADGDVSDQDETIQYRYDRSAKTLWRGLPPVGGVFTVPQELLLDNIDTLSVDFLTANGTRISNPADVANTRQIRIRMITLTVSKTGAVKSRQGRQRNEFEVTFAPRNYGL